MSFTRHIAACNRFDPAKFLPFRCDGAPIGLIRRDHLPVLAARHDLFAVGDDAVDLVVSGGPAERSAALDGFAQSLQQGGLIRGLRREPFAVTRRWGEPALFHLDRGAVPFFGTRSYGVHLNGLRRPDARSLWIGKRANDKRVAPGKLDNMVAGGIAAGYDAAETLVKEAAEEANMPPALVATATSAGAIVYRMEVEEGVRDDVLFVYDVVLPESFEPENTDGEFDSFAIRDLDGVLREIGETDAFKFNVNLVIIDLALRHGVIAPDHPNISTS